MTDVWLEVRSDFHRVKYRAFQMALRSLVNVPTRGLLRNEFCLCLSQPDRQGQSSFKNHNERNLNPELYLQSVRL